MRRVLKATLVCDLQRIARDQFLLGTAFFVVGVALLLRFGLPWIAAALAARQGIDLAPYQGLLASYFVLINAQMVAGLILGFLLIESREEGVMQALRVGPTSLFTILCSKILLAFGLSVLLCLLLGVVLGLGVPPPQETLVTALLASPMSVAYALILGALADNKVQAFATAKIISLLGLVPPVVYFVPKPWQWLGGLIPVYWPCKAWWAIEQGEAWHGYIAPGLVVSSLWVLVLLRVFRRSVAGS